MPSTSARLWQRTASPLAIALMTVMWVLLWGDPSPGNFVAGFFLSLGVVWVLPVPRGPNRRLTIRPIAFARLALVFIKDIIMAATQIAWVIITGRVPREAIIRVQTRAHSDGFLTATAGFTALVPGSVAVDAHRLTGTLYVHIFDVDEGEEAIAKAHTNVLEQEERILRALASDEELMDAGFRPGGSMKAGRLTDEEMAAHRERVAARQRQADERRRA
ncbi:MAG: Na+/H+ antiporter subunit E [Brooklawnia sp.]|jgi:multicomponent Na+:H+ antiporter subunit E